MLNSTYKVEDLLEFKPFLLEKKRIMGLDLGKKRININNNYFEIVSLICSKFQIKMQTWK